jgi:hypothetical protein
MTKKKINGIETRLPPEDLESPLHTLPMLMNSRSVKVSISDFRRHILCGILTFQIK